MTQSARIKAALPPLGLILMGGVQRRAPAPETLFLLGCGPDFWQVFTRCAEYGDGVPDPLDRWSRRVLSDLAAQIGARVEFPFGGPPYAPFLRHALDSGQSHPSPVGMLVHGRAGMMISFRGALIVDGIHDVPAALPNPCGPCPRPCTTACPVGALSESAPYDVAACKDHLQSAAGQDCRKHGCLVRRACPVSARFGRDPAQSGFHMEAFVTA